ncbi:hypothetical protein HYALB_00002208 [Hymenoscyphus albidus]|uniref:Radical SAM core domain-containing protein n=1 Tax=Hymenoscyphus albidus TaxID=595503 RepID=A0A9N9LJE9_9HELO|nr:hypothetical protein HYALB_00002208 [Hymenoscyphus albidus]
MLSLEDAQRGMRLLKEAGMKKLNFAGGEPFLYPNFLGPLLRCGKVDLKIERISIVSNGSKIKEKFLRKHAAFIDILAISCDSFDPNTNIQIGRGKDGDNIKTLTKIAGWCRELGIKFKINTVVSPFRWKVFQCLIVTGENDNGERKRDARSLLVSQQQWQTFCDQHKHLECFVPESNDMIKGSYLILDESMTFLDKGDGEERARESILDVGVKTAMSQVRWEQTTFLTRGGVYDWTKARPSEGCGTQNKELEW